MVSLKQKSGAQAKANGHTLEEEIADWMTSMKDVIHTVDGGNDTKRDILNHHQDLFYSHKSVSGKNTQCHLTSSNVWCTYFGISGELKKWFDLFFGVPHTDISHGSNRQHRVTKTMIPVLLNQKALDWFNSHKVEIFDAIVRKGIYQDKKTKLIFQGDPVTHLSWYNKASKDFTAIEYYSMDDLLDLVKSGEWVLNETTLHFIDANNNKLFHLQMKGSGKRYSSSYHSLMFHIHKPYVDRA